MKYFSIIIIVFLFFSCSFNGWNKYTVSANQDRFYPLKREHLYINTGLEIRCSISFSKDCIYQHEIKGKLNEFNRGPFIARVETNNNESGVYIGWIPNSEKGQIDLFFYQISDNGYLIKSDIKTSVNPSEVINAFFIFTDNNEVITGFEQEKGYPRVDVWKFSRMDFRGVYQENPNIGIGDFSTTQSELIHSPKRMTINIKSEILRAYE